MALGKQNRGSVSDNKLLVLRLKRKAVNKETGKEEELFPNKFEITEKIGDKWVAREELETNVAGDIVRLDLGTGEYQGAEYRTAKLYLEDNKAKEIYMLDLRSTNLTRQLFAKLIALTEFKNVEISNYSKISAKNGVTYANISVWQNGNMVRDNIALADIPKPDEIKDKKGVVVKRDYEEVDKFWWTHLEKLQKAIEAANKGNSKSTPKEKEDVPPASDADSASDSDVPF